MLNLYEKKYKKYKIKSLYDNKMGLLSYSYSALLADGEMDEVDSSEVQILQVVV